MRHEQKMHRLKTLKQRAAFIQLCDEKAATTIPDFMKDIASHGGIPDSIDFNQGDEQARNCM